MCVWVFDLRKQLHSMSRNNFGGGWKLRVWSIIVYTFSSSSWNAFILRHKSFCITLLEEVFGLRVIKLSFLCKKKGRLISILLWEKKDLKVLQKKFVTVYALQIWSLLKETSLQEGEFYFHGIILPHIISYDKRFDK